jgi:hypothetical protein
MGLLLEYYINLVLSVSKFFFDLGCAFLKESSGVPPEFREQMFEIAGTWFLLPQEPQK